MDGTMHQIGEVAEAVGLSLRTIRHYEEVGLVPPSGRTTGGFRLYTDADIDRLRLVKRMKPLEFSLDEMRELLDTLDRVGSGDRDADGMGLLTQRLGDFAATAQQRCETLRSRLEAAEGMARMLRAKALGPAVQPRR